MYDENEEFIRDAFPTLYIYIQRKTNREFRTSRSVSLHDSDMTHITTVLLTR
jgi:hypothetical protein